MSPEVLLVLISFTHFTRGFCNKQILIRRVLTIVFFTANLFTEHRKVESWPYFTGFGGNVENKNFQESETKKRLGIIGGMNAKPGQFPYQVFILYQTLTGVFQCGGSLIFYDTVRFESFLF
jgi:hypothetical protein